MSDIVKKDVNTLPVPFSESWRQAYRYTGSDLPRLATYQAPGSVPVPFILETVRFSGGQAVDIAEFTGFGDWTNITLNNKTQSLTVSGFVRGEKYIKNRNELAAGLVKNTEDDSPGYIELPTWGRFAIVVLTYDLEESADKHGQCKLSITFNRAGISDIERFSEGISTTLDVQSASEKLRDTAIDKLSEAIEKAKDSDTLAAGFTAIKEKLIKVVGVLQSPAETLNRLTNEVTQITNLIAQGVRAPKDLLLTLFSSVTSIAAGFADIRNAAMEYTTLSNPFTGNNMLKIAQQFLSNTGATFDIEAITKKEQNTKTQLENAYRLTSLYAAALVLPELEKITCNKALSLLSLYTNLENSINQNDPDLYRAVTDLRVAVTEVLAKKKLVNELQTNLMSSLAILPLSHHLGCDETRLRELNDIVDSFAVKGLVRYV